MPFNGSGVFSPVYSWVQDASNGIKILASRMDTQDEDFATNGFTNCITRDGQGMPTQTINWNGQDLTNVGTLNAATLAVSGNAAIQSVTVTNLLSGPLSGTQAGMLSNGTFTINLPLSVKAYELFLSNSANSDLPYLYILGSDGSTNQGTITPVAGSSVISVSVNGLVITVTNISAFTATITWSLTQRTP